MSWCVKDSEGIYSAWRAEDKLRVRTKATGEVVVHVLIFVLGTLNIFFRIMKSQ